MKVPLKSFHLNGHFTGFCPQTQKLKCAMRLYHLALAVDGLIHSINAGGNKNKENFRLIENKRFPSLHAPDVNTRRCWKNLGQFNIHTHDEVEMKLGAFIM